MPQLDANRDIRPSGYADPAYAESLAEFGVPRRLPRSQGSLLVRQLPRLSDRDAMGPYPLFSCVDWSQLPADLEDVGDDLVSVSVVTTPFGNWTPRLLARCFPDRVERYKEHFVVDLSRPPLHSVSAHHRRQATRAAGRLDVERVEDPRRLFDEWNSLYRDLIRRHHITGLPAFSPNAFSRQLRLQGLVALRAASAGETLGISLWLVEDDVAYYHLAASSERGYDRDASYALLAFALEQFAADGLEWLSLGAGAGIRHDPSDGLSRFKAGWASGTRPAYLCGRILDPRRYIELAKGRRRSAVSYFPAYREEVSP